MTGSDRLRVGACLSLSGRFARFGRQAAAALDVWRRLDGGVELRVEDDESDPARLDATIAGVAADCDILLGPYSTQLVRRAGRLAAESGWLLWNHGGSGDDVEAAQPGHVLSVLTPTSRYAEPFLDRLVDDDVGATLWVRHGTGRFGRQVAHGAAAAARRLGISTVLAGPDDEVAPAPPWHLFSAGTFEDDVAFVRRSLATAEPPLLVCSVAAAVRSFADALGTRPDDIYGVGQWFPGAIRDVRLGPDEATFLSAYTRATGVQPDYPATQAVAAAAIAVHCTRHAGATARDQVWPIAAQLRTTTLFGAFGIDPSIGSQIDHDTVLVRWTDDGLAPAP